MNSIISPIAYIHNDFDEKFGIPRQSGIASESTSIIVFEKEYRNIDAVRGLESFSYIWLIWQFSECVGKKWTPTVRPPRLGGNKRIGVFATRSPFRPNNLGLSSVKLEKIDFTSPDSPILYVSGADLKNMTPIFDIKPYLPYTDSHDNANTGFVSDTQWKKLDVEYSKEIQGLIPQEKISALTQILSEDPRPSYQADDSRVYGMNYAGMNIHFTVSNDTLTVISVENTL